MSDHFTRLIESESEAMRQAIDGWSARVRRIRHSDGPLALHEAEIMREELGVAEEELRSQQEELLVARMSAELERAQYQQLFDSAPVPYLLSDSAGVVQVANSSACAMLGVEAGRLTGKPLSVFIHPDVRPAFRRDLIDISASGEQTGSFRTSIISRDGTQHEVTTVLGVVRDSSLRVTDLRWLIVPDAVALRGERERLLRESELARLAAEDANRAKTELLATVSHELRTPLTAIGGYSELLEIGLRGPLSPEQLDDVRRIHRAQHHMIGLLDDLLLYFRLGLGGLSAQVTVVRIDDILTGLQSFVAPQANQRRVSITIPPTASGQRVLADVDRARQIVLNLLTNAVKFSPADGNVTVSVRDTPDAVIIEVRDEGPGIPDERLDTVFEPFVQLAEPGTPGRGGFGLGLAISRRLAELMGGDLRALPLKGGACFQLRLTRFV